MKILIALDFTEEARTIIEYVKSLDIASHVQIWILHVAEPEPDFVGYDVDPTIMRNLTAKKYHKEHRQLQLIRRKLCTSFSQCTSLLVQGSIADTILDEASKLSVDMIIIGSHGKWGTTSLIAGSTSKAVLHQSSVPVLVIPFMYSAK